MNTNGSIQEAESVLKIHSQVITEIPGFLVEKFISAYLPDPDVKCLLVGVIRKPGRVPLPGLWAYLPRLG